MTTTNTNTNTNSTTTNASSSTTTTTVTTVSSSSMNKLLKVHHRSSVSSFKSATTTEVSSKDVVTKAAVASNRFRSEGFSFGFRSDVKRKVNQCFGCRRKVGLTGFQCRCGELFCAEHRYTTCAATITKPLVATI